MTSRLVTKCMLELCKEKLKTFKIYFGRKRTIFQVVGASLAYKTNSEFFLLHFTRNTYKWKGQNLSLQFRTKGKKERFYEKGNLNIKVLKHHVDRQTLFSYINNKNKVNSMY